jgi:hypothetical protein
MGTVTLREKHKLMEFENKVFRKIGVSKNVEQNEDREYCEIQSFTMCTPYRMLFMYQMQEAEKGGPCCTYVVREKCARSYGGVT